MCQVHTGAYVSLLAPGKTDYTACHPRKTPTYILHVVPITTNTHGRRKLIGEKKTKKRKEDKGKKREESEKRKGKYHTTAPTVAWLSLLLLLAANQRGAFLAALAGSVYHTTTAARGIDAVLLMTATPAVV